MAKRFYSNSESLSKRRTPRKKNEEKAEFVVSNTTEFKKEVSNHANKHNHAENEHFYEGIVIYTMYNIGGNNFSITDFNKEDKAVLKIDLIKLWW